MNSEHLNGTFYIWKAVASVICNIHSSTIIFGIVVHKYQIVFDHRTITLQEVTGFTSKYIPPPSSAKLLNSLNVPGS